MSSMKRSAVVYGGLLAVLMGAAWVQWTAEPAVELDGKVVLLQGEQDNVEKIVWHVENKDEAVIERRGDAYGSYLWVTYTRWSEVKPSSPLDPEKSDGEEEEEEGEDAPEAEAPDADKTYEAETQQFKAGDAGDELVASLSPMLAIRKLDQVDDSKLESIGLVTPTDRLEITRKGRTVILDIGGEVFGTRDRYVRDRSSGDIYLVDDEILRPLKYARTRLPDREIWDVERKDIVKVTVTDADGVAASFLQKNGADQAKAYWVAEGAEVADGDEKDAQLDTWMDKALNMRGTRYADPESPPPDLSTVFRLEVAGEDGKVIPVLVEKDGGEGDYWATTPYTRGKVKLLRTATESLAEDVSTITN